MNSSVALVGGMFPYRNQLVPQGLSTSNIKRIISIFSFNIVQKYNTNSSPEMNPFMRHCEKETLIPKEGKVTGRIPDWLEGTLIRNGTGIHEIGKYKYKHAFDGLAILHKFQIKNGKATYQNRALESDSYKMNMKAQRIVASEFGTKGFPDPCESLFSRLKSTFSKSSMDMTDNCSVNVGYYGDQLYTMTETCFVRRINPNNLETYPEKTNITDYVAVNTATAHPQILEDGSILNMGTSFRHKKGPHYIFIKVPPAFNNEETCFKNAQIIAELKCRWKLSPCYFHSFGLTKKRIVFIEQPLCLNAIKLATSAYFNYSFRDCMKWHSNEKTRIHLISLEDGKVHDTIYETENLFIFHHINSYEDGENVIVDVAAYENGNIVMSLEESSKDENKKVVAGASARRYILPLNVPKDAKPGDELLGEEMLAKASVHSYENGVPVINCKPHHFTNQIFELPRINYKFNREKYNFFYGLTSDLRTDHATPQLNKIIKVDIVTGKEISWEGGNVITSEPIFVQNPQSGVIEGEDDGVILSAITWLDDAKKVTLLILDARDMKEMAKIDFEASGTVPSTFHGQWAHENEKIHYY